MKKLFALATTVCLVATMFCVTAFAADDGAAWVELDTYGTTYAGAIFGDGSLAMIVALIALAASAFSIFLTLHLNKKKDDPSAKKDTEESEDEE